MFGFFKKTKSAKELDRIIAEITMNMQNNYKDAAQSAFKELEQRFNEMAEAGELSEAQKHIEQNVNAKMIFFDMALRMIVWIKNR
mgnify:CR=1 FL=1